MAFSRDEVMAMLDALAAPLGPMGSHEERLARQDRWMAEGGDGLLDALITLIASPPAQLTYASPDDWTTLLIEVTGSLGARSPDVALPKLLPLLDDPRARATAIDVLGSVGDVRAVPAFARLVRDTPLGEPEFVHLVGALGEIGGDEARSLLTQLRDAARPTQHELRREIALAEQLARG